MDRNVKGMLMGGSRCEYFMFVVGVEIDIITQFSGI